MKTLITLEEHNKKAIKKHKIEQYPTNGIACPECGNELVDSEPHATLMSMPPQKQIACLKCKYSGYRIA
jgi:hypothetical protein